ncbi:MAG: hypothetical protein KBT10_10475, partial [Bacteroidales bacterium]|nr:hypothetical protein [Candidatus Sodaliphilus aphodohippi]
AALQKLFAAYNCTSPSVFLKTDDCFCTSFVTLELIAFIFSSIKHITRAGMHTLKQQNGHQLTIFDECSIAKVKKNM